VPQDKIEFSQRTFKVLDEFTIEFSAPFTGDFVEDEGLSGSLRVDKRFGEIMGLDVYGNRLLIIQRFGFATLESAFDPSMFNLQPFAKSYEPIVDGTVRVLGDTIIFLTNGGMCRVSRNGQVQLLDIPMPNQTFGSWIENNRYHLQLLDSVLVIEKFFDSFFYLTDGYLWESDDFSVGYAANRQFVKQVRIKTSADITLTVLNEKREQRVQVRGRNRVQTLNINLKGESFRIRIEGASNVTDLVVVIGFNT